MEATIYNAFRVGFNSRSTSQRSSEQPKASTTESAPSPAATSSDRDSARANTLFNGETLITLNDAIAHFPNRPHIKLVYRWRRKGVGGVVLESFRVGGKWYTSEQAIERFLERQNPQLQQQQKQPTSAPQTKRRSRNKGLDAASSSERLKKRLKVEPGRPDSNGNSSGFRRHADNVPLDQRGSAFRRHTDDEQSEPKEQQEPKGRKRRKGRKGGRDE
ncbi:MAG: DUF1580 domain-containing protein [Phycisphaerales bacterium]